MKLTKGAIEKLKPPSKGSIIKWDGENARGFGVRVTSNGVASFVLAYRLHGRQSKFTIGKVDEWTVDDARNEADQLRTEIRDGVDPHARARQERGEMTVEKLSEEFMEKHAASLRPGTVRGYREMLRDHILPEIGRLGVNAVNERDVLTIKAATKETPYRANRCLSLISAVFNKGIAWKLCERNPAKDVEHYPEDTREFWLNASQYRALDAAISFYGRDCGDAIRLLILTGAREQEVLGASWAEFDLDPEHAIWTRSSHRTKERKMERVVISDAALAVLRRMKKAATGAYLFPGKEVPGKAPRPRRTIRKPWIQICKAAGLSTEYEVQGKRKMLKRWKPSLRLHDLRHSYASWLVSDGVSLKRVGKLLGQSQEATTRRYAHLADKSVRDATNAFGNSLKWVS
jgi:integrase